jgi:hypothetical protein
VVCFSFADEKTEEESAEKSTKKQKARGKKKEKSKTKIHKRNSPRTVKDKSDSDSSETSERFTFEGKKHRFTKNSMDYELYATCKHSTKKKNIEYSTGTEVKVKRTTYVVVLSGRSSSQTSRASNKHVVLLYHPLQDTVSLHGLHEVSPVPRPRGLCVSREDKQALLYLAKDYFNPVPPSSPSAAKDNTDEEKSNRRSSSRKNPSESEDRTGAEQLKALQELRVALREEAQVLQKRREELQRAEKELENKRKEQDKQNRQSKTKRKQDNSDDEGDNVEDKVLLKPAKKFKRDDEQEPVGSSSSLWMVVTIFCAHRGASLTSLTYASLCRLSRTHLHTEPERQCGIRGARMATTSARGKSCGLSVNSPRVIGAICYSMCFLVCVGASLLISGPLQLLNGDVCVRRGTNKKTGS